MSEPIETIQQTRNNTSDPNSYQLTKKVKSFVDISLSFEPNPVTGDLTLLRNDRAISNAIKNIILTAPLEVPFFRDMGSVVSTYLFDFIDDGTAGQISIEVDRAINFNEPRVDNVVSTVRPRPDANIFEVTVQYRIIGWNETFTVTQILKPSR